MAARGAQASWAAAGLGHSGPRDRPRLARRRDRFLTQQLPAPRAGAVRVRAPEVRQRRRLPVPALAALTEGDGPESSGTLSRRLNLGWTAPRSQPQSGRRRGAARPWRAVPRPGLGPGSCGGSGGSPKWRPPRPAAGRLAHGTGVPSARRRGSRERRGRTRPGAPAPATSRETSRPEAAAAQTLARLRQTGGAVRHAAPRSRVSSRRRLGSGGKVGGDGWGRPLPPAGPGSPGPPRRRLREPRAAPAGPGTARTRRGDPGVRSSRPRRGQPRHGLSPSVKGVAAPPRPRFLPARCPNLCPGRTQVSCSG